MDLKLSKITDSVNSEIFYSPEHALVIIRLKDIDVIDEEQYKKDSVAFLEFVKSAGVRRLLFDTSKLRAVFSVELQKWVAENINRELLRLLEKVAVIPPKDVVSQISLQQYIEESNRYGVRGKEFTFDDEEKALKWLLK